MASIAPSKHRGHNEGSIHYREDKALWVAVLSLPDGKRRYLYAKAKKDVQAKLRQAQQDQDKGTAVAPDRQTAGQFLADWLEKSAKRSVRPKTYASYAVYVNKHLIPRLGKTKLQKLTPADVEACLNGCLDAGLSPRSVKNAHGVLRKALNQAVKWGLAPRNVCALVDAPRAPRFEVAPLTPDQARALLDAAKGDRLEALYLTALYCGLRQGEVLGLHWQDVDLQAGALTVRLALQYTAKAGLRFVEPKSKQSRRTVTLPATVTAVLREHRTRQLEERLQAGAYWQDGDLVFATTLGTPMDPRNLIRHFHRIRKAAGLPELRFHDLRHGCATLLLAQGVHPKIVQELLGHSRISMTMDTYSHVMPSLHREAADKMDALLGRTVEAS